MKFTASSAQLLKALTTVNGAVPTKSTMPILECILFEREGEHLRLSASDLQIAIMQDVSVHFESNGSERANRVAVPAKRLLDTLRALPDLPISFTADDEFNIELQTEQGLYKMVGHDGADFPAMADLNDEQKMDLDSAILRRAIQKTSFAVSRDALRPAMMGIYFQVGNDSGRLVSTDGHRLVRLSLDDFTIDNSTTFIVPEKAMTLCARVLESGPCTLSVDTNHAGFTFENGRVVARLIDEPYPNYEAVIPVENDKRLVINRDAMLAAVKRVGLYSSSMSNQIRLSISNDQVKISAEDIERSSEAHETVLCDYDGDDMVIGFNATYLTEVLSHIDADDVVFELSSPNRAGIVTPMEQREGEELMMLIMPVMLNTYA